MISRDVARVMKERIPSSSLSVTALAWGILLEWWWLGLILGVLIESVKYVKWRRAFTGDDFSRAFTLGYLLLILTALVFWLQDSDTQQYALLGKLLPVFFLPVLICQLYHTKPYFPLPASSLLTYWRYKRERAEGKNSPVWGLNFQYLYLALLLISCAKGLDTLYLKLGYIVLVLVVLWRLLARGGVGRGVGHYILYGVCGVIGAVMMYGFILLYLFFDSGKWYKYFSNIDTPEQTSTALGQIGEINKDPAIHWRLIQAKGAPPRLLRDRVFNRYANRSWFHDPISVGKRSEDYAEMVIAPYEGKAAFYLNEEGASEGTAVERHYHIRGKGQKQTMLPVMDSLALIVSSTVDSISYNSLGTVVSQSLGEGVLDYQCYVGATEDVARMEYPADEEKDLIVPEKLHEALDRFLAEEGVPQKVEWPEACMMLRQVFAEDFRYTSVGEIQGELPIKKFLHTNKAGHCEYFATAGVMLLRRMGIPARYVIGYSVSEYHEERNEWVLRGLHAHAWIRVWDAKAEVWRDVDLTPGGDDENATHKTPFYQGVLDGITRWQEDFTVWRLQNNDSWLLRVAPWILVAILVVIFGRHLIKGGVGAQKDSGLRSYMAPLIRRLKVAPPAESESWEEWVMKLDLPAQERGLLSVEVERFLYGEGCLETKNVKKLKERIAKTVYYVKTNK